MKSLIITTGTSKIVLSRWLPLLREVGEYQGDVLVLDYGDINYFGTPVKLSKRFMEELSKQPNVTVLNPVRKLKNIFIDRLVVAQDYLKDHPEYDVIGFMDGNDTIFWGSIGPLLDQAEHIVCYIKEHPSNLLSIWGDFGPRPFCKKHFSDLMNYPIVNGGVLFGPRREMDKLLTGIFQLVKLYGDEPSDQVFLDIILYKKRVYCKEVGSEWNYTHAVIGFGPTGAPNGPRTPVFKNGKAYKVEDGTPVIIEHRTGTGHRLWGSRYAVRMLESDKPVSIMAEYEGRNYLFPEGSKRQNEDLKESATRKDNFLFPFNPQIKDNLKF